MRERSYLRKIVEYIKKNLGKGYSEESLMWSLVHQGYSRTEVNHALQVAKEELAKERFDKDKPIIKYEVIDEDNEPVIIVNKPWWKRILGLD